MKMIPTARSFGRPKLASGNLLGEILRREPFATIGEAARRDILLPEIGWKEALRVFFICFMAGFLTALLADNVPFGVFLAMGVAVYASLAEQFYMGLRRKIEAFRC